MILAPPNKPRKIRLKWCIQTFELCVGWEDSEIARGTTIDSYQVQIRDEEEEEEEENWKTPTSCDEIYYTQTTLQVSSVLRLARSYRVRVRAHNMGGWSEWCESSKPIRTSERSFEMKIIDKHVHVMKQFCVSLTLRGRTPLRTSWIGIFPVSSSDVLLSTSSSTLLSSNKCVGSYTMKEILSSPKKHSKKKNSVNFTWKADRGFPEDGQYQFCYFDSRSEDKSITPSWCSDVFTVYTPDENAFPQHIMQHLYVTRAQQGKERVSCAENVVIPCHAWVLALRSPVLYGMLYECKDEDEVNDTNVRKFSLKYSRRGGIVLDLPEISADVFRAFLRWAYTNEIVIDENENISDGLLCFADRFDILGLYLEMKSRVLKVLNANRAVTLLMMTYDDCEGDAFRVRDVVSQYIGRNGPEVANSRSFEAVQDEESLRRVEDALSNNMKDEEELWMYKDEIDAEHGPFKTSQLRRWVELDKLSSELRVRSVTRDVFVPLSSTKILSDSSVKNSKTSLNVEVKEKNVENELEIAIQREFFSNFYFETKVEGIRRYVSKFWLKHRSRGLYQCLIENQEKHGVVLNISPKLLDNLVKFVYTGRLVASNDDFTALECVSLLSFTLRFSLPVLARKVTEKLMRLECISTKELVQCFRHVSSLLPFYKNVWTFLLSRINKDNAHEIFVIISESNVVKLRHDVLKRCTVFMTNDEEEKSDDDKTGLSSIVRHLKNLQNPDINSQDLDTLMKGVKQSNVSLMFISNCLPIVRKLLRDENNQDIILTLDDQRGILILLTLAMLVRRSPDKKILGDRFVDWLWSRFDVLKDGSPTLLNGLEELKRVPYWVHEKDVDYLRTIAIEHILSRPGLCHSESLSFSLKKFLLKYRMRVDTTSTTTTTTSSSSIL